MFKLSGNVIKVKIIVFFFLNIFEWTFDNIIFWKFVISIHIIYENKLVMANQNEHYGNNKFRLHTNVWFQYNKIYNSCVNQNS